MRGWLVHWLLKSHGARRRTKGYGYFLIGKIIEMSRGHLDSGITTEVALLLMFAVGAYLVVGDRAAAIAIGGGAAALLHFMA
jgi:uncharacterized membrane protein (DUF4010 family)